MSPQCIAIMSLPSSLPAPRLIARWMVSLVILLLKALSIGDEYFVRYVPQSRYFQSQELIISGENCNKKVIDEINKKRSFYRKKILLKDVHGTN